MTSRTANVRRTLLAGISLLLLASCDTPNRLRRLPPPTELGETAEQEGEHQRARELWEEMRHGAPPEVWRAIEAGNRRRNLEARAALLREGRAAAPAWRERGSFDQSGRTYVTVVGADGKTLLVGTDAGGIFSGLPGGRSWVPRSDGLGLGVRSLVAVPGHPEVWVASGDNGPVYTSTNGGATWSVARGGPVIGEWVARILRDPVHPRTVYVLGASAGRYTLYRSEDGGLQLTAVSSGPCLGIPDLWMDRVRGGPIYLMVQSELRKSTDRGTTFKRIGRLPVTTHDVILAGSEAGAPTFYVAARDTNTWAFFVSENGGRTWREGAKPPFFWEALNASITNPKLVFFGGIDLYRSTDAGRTLKVIHPWYEYYQAPDTRLHADVMGIDCLYYRGKETVFFNTDGGTYRSEDGGLTVRNVTRYGLGNSEYYGILTSVNNSNRIAAGAQDQGYQVSRPSARAVLGFDQLISGDYGSLTSSDGTHNMLYSSYPGFVLVQMREGAADLESFPFPPPPDELRQFWIAPLAADPGDPEVVYFGDRRIWRVVRQAANDYATEALPQDFGAGSDGDYVSAFAISPADPGRWVAATAQGRLWHTRDNGQTWTLGHKIDNFYSTDVLPSPTDADTFYVAGSSYFDGNSVYRTSDGGATWEPRATGLPRTLVNALAFGDPGRQELYAATQAGPFHYDEATDTWVSLLGTEAPLTAYRDVEGVPAAGVVRFATYGRGIWDYSPAP